MALRVSIRDFQLQGVGILSFDSENNNILEYYLSDLSVDLFFVDLICLLQLKLTHMSMTKCCVRDFVKYMIILPS